MSAVSVNPWVKMRFEVNDSFFFFFGERNDYSQRRGCQESPLES